MGRLEWCSADTVFGRSSSVFRRLMRPDDILEFFSEFAVKASDLMRLVLQSSVAALVNAQSVEAIEAELKCRAVKEN